jgi:hypothetical protein
VYPNVPLSQIVRVGKHELSATDWDLYLKTSVDFVLVDPVARPSLAVEFDGMGGGFSSSTTYVQVRPTRDPKREAKIQCEMDPFLRRCSQQYERFAATRSRVSIEPLFDPDIVTHMRQKVPFESVGCRFTAEVEVLPRPVSMVVWVRNWAGEELSGILSAECPVKSGVNPLCVAQNIAECLGQEQVLRLIDEKGLSDKSADQYGSPQAGTG